MTSFNSVAPSRQLLDGKTGSRPARRRVRFRPRLERLEARLAPAVHDITTGMSFSTIQGAINAANPGDVILADAGAYAEQVTINKTITLEGAQHGADARNPARTGLPATESVMDSTGNTPLEVTANNVTIDGFTVQGVTNANVFGFGILLGAGTSGSQILNNIIQNNIAGMSLANNPSGSPALIQHNLFRDNNQPGPLSGTSIYSDQFNAGGNLANVVVDSNIFVNDQNAGIYLGSTAATQSNITISNNEMNGDGNGVLLLNTTNATVSGNAFSGSLGSQVVVGGGVSGLKITQNFIENGATNGIRLGDFGGGSANSLVTVFDNSITGNATSGLAIQTGTGQYTGTLDARFNWWGSATGPTNSRNAGGTGQTIIDPGSQVLFSPWLASAADLQPATPGFQGDLSAINPPQYIAVAADSGNTVNVYNAFSGSLKSTFLAFDPSYKGGVRIAVGDVNADGVPDIIVATGPGIAPMVKVIDGTKLNLIDGDGEIDSAAVLASFDAYDPRFLGGVYVAFGRSTNALPEIITGADAGGGPHVKVINGTKLNQLQGSGEIADSALIAQFYAYSPAFPGGVRVAAADLNNDGIQDIVTGAGPGGGPHVKVIDGSKFAQLQANGEIAESALLGQFYAYTANSTTFTGGVYVAADSNGGHPIVVTGMGSIPAGSITTQPTVKVIDATKLNVLDAGSEPTGAALLGNFLAYDPAFSGGVRVAAFDVNADGVADIITGPGPGGGPQIKVVDGTKLTDVQPNKEIADSALLDNFFAFSPSFNAGVFVGGG